LRENGPDRRDVLRVSGAPKILRLHRQGRVVEPYEAELAALQVPFPVYEGTRAIMVVDHADLPLLRLGRAFVK
jgi:hypothetical protein